jgi:hypothetical protein
VKLVPGHALCACSWHGTLGAKTPCPACGRPATDRIDEGRIEVLRKVLARADVELVRTQAIRLIEIGVLRRDGPAAPPNHGDPQRRPPRRRHAVTTLGLGVISTADQLERGGK